MNLIKRSRKEIFLLCAGVALFMPGAAKKVFGADTSIVTPVTSEEYHNNSEAELLWKMNQLRVNPRDTLIKVLKIPESEWTDKVNKYVATVETAAPGDNIQYQMAPIAPHESIGKAAEEHADNIITTGFADHELNGTTPEQLMKKALSEQDIPQVFRGGAENLTTDHVGDESYSYCPLDRKQHRNALAAFAMSPDGHFNTMIGGAMFAGIGIESGYHGGKQSRGYGLALVQNFADID